MTAKVRSYPVFLREIIDGLAMGKVAVVTGAGRGLGRKIAERLGRRNIHVVVTDIDEASARDTAALCHGTGLKQDVRDPDSHRAVAQLAREHGELAIWVNNAGILAVGDSAQISDADTRRMIEVNLLGVIWGCHAALAHMETGTIINIASMSSLAPAPGLAVYGAAKHGVLAYSLALAGELRRARRGVSQQGSFAAGDFASLLRRTRNRSDGSVSQQGSFAAGSFASLLRRTRNRSDGSVSVSALCPDAIAGDMTDAVAHDAAAGILFSSGKLLSQDEVADAAVELVDHPRLVRTIPAFRAALIHLLRPFPSIGLPVLEQFAKLGRRRQR